MKKKSSKPIRLNRETLVPLEPSGLKLAGGVFTHTCPPTVRNPNSGCRTCP